MAVCVLISLYFVFYLCLAAAVAPDHVSVILSGARVIAIYVAVEQGSTFFE